MIMGLGGSYRPRPRRRCEGEGGLLAEQHAAAKAPAPIETGIAILAGTARSRGWQRGTAEIAGERRSRRCGKSPARIDRCIGYVKAALVDVVRGLLQEQAAHVAMRNDEPRLATIYPHTRAITTVYSFVENSADHRIYNPAPLDNNRAIHHMHRKKYIPNNALLN